MPAPLKNIRVPQDTWNLALAVTKRRGETVSGILVDALERYLKRHATDAERAEHLADESPAA